MTDDNSSGNQFTEVLGRVNHYARWTINNNLKEPELEYLEWIKENNPTRARTVYYGLPGAYEGMVFAQYIKDNKEFILDTETYSFEGKNPMIEVFKCHNTPDISNRRRKRKSSKWASEEINEYEQSSRENHRNRDS